MFGQGRSSTDFRVSLLELFHANSRKLEVRPVRLGRIAILVWQNAETVRNEWTIHESWPRCEPSHTADRFEVQWRPRQPPNETYNTTQGHADQSTTGAGVRLRICQIRSQKGPVLRKLSDGSTDLPRPGS